MGNIRTLANAAFRDYVTDGVPASGAFNPSKSAIRALFGAVESAVPDVSLFAAANPADGSFDPGQIMSQAAYMAETENDISPDLRVIGTFDAFKIAYSSGGSWDCSTMIRGVMKYGYVRSTGTDLVIWLGPGQSFQNGSNKVTIGKGRFFGIIRLLNTFYLWAPPLTGADAAFYNVQAGPSGTIYWVGCARLDGYWDLTAKINTDSPSTDTYTLPSGWSGLNDTKCSYVAALGDEATYSASNPYYGIACKKVDDTNITVDNPNASSQVGASTQIVLRIQRLTYVPTGSGVGMITYETADPTDRAYTLVVAGQSQEQLAMAGEGASSFYRQVLVRTTNQKIYWVNQSYSGSTMLKPASGTNYWWDHTTNAAGPWTTALIAGINAAIAAGQPAPAYVFFGQGASDALNYGVSGYGYVTGPAWTAAFNAMVAAIRVGTSLPGLKFIMLPLGRWGASGVDVGMNVIRQAQLACIDGVNVIHGADGLLASLRESGAVGVHYNASGQNRVWTPNADLWLNLALGQANALGPTVAGIAQVAGSLRNFDVTFAPSSGALKQPASPYWGALLPANDPAGAPIAMDPDTPATWQSANVLRVRTAADQATKPWLCCPYGGAAVPYVNMITDGTGYVLRSRTMLQAT